MLGAIKWGFSRDTRRSSTWIWDAKSEAFTGNPAHCVKLARYMNSLHRKKTANGECATSSRAINGYHMQQLSDHLNGWLRNNADLDRSSQRSQDDWGGPLKRFSTYLIGLIAFRCLLRTCDVVKLTMDHLSFEPLNGDRTHVSIQPWTSKTQQTGSVEPFDFFLETDEKLLDFCIVRALHRWLKMSGIRQGNLFPKIYGYDSMQDSERGPPTSKTDFLKNLRCSLQDIGETPSKFTIHAFRRGGTQFLYEVLKFNLIKILQWGKWSTKLTYATILRYLIADTDLMKTPRSLIMYPNRA
ncbi:hypothetical protein D9757_015016 [Collybiopsis confluens]|nr:hypothetical protein D9757_015016 [Collybiopsis confluens]